MGFFLFNRLNHSSLFDQNTNHIIVLDSSEHSETFYDKLKRSAIPNNFMLHHFTALEESPYKKIIYSEEEFNKLFQIYQNIIFSPKKHIVICTIESLLFKNPPLLFFQSNTVNIQTSDILPPETLSKKLESIGYIEKANIDKPGTFSQKGEIFDIFPFQKTPSEFTISMKKLKQSIA